MGALTTFEQVREQMNYAMQEHTDAVTTALFDCREDRLDRMARQAGRVTFGDILNPTPDPLAGLKSLFSQSKEPSCL